MYFEGTNYLLKNLVLLETLFCVNRSYLIKERRRKLLCNTLFAISLINIVGCLIYDYLVLGIQLSLTNKFIQIYNGVELLSLAASGIGVKKVFEVQNRLDIKCGFDDIYMNKFKRMVNTALTVNVLSVVMNFLCTWYVGLEFSVSLTYNYATVAHDMEMDVIRLLIQGYNLRLSTLRDVTPLAGCKIYRHLLISAAHLCEDFSSRVSIISFDILLNVYHTE